MATEDLGHGMTSNDAMLQRTRWLYGGGPTPSGLEDTAQKVIQEKKQSGFLNLIKNWFNSF